MMVRSIIRQVERNLTVSVGSNPNQLSKASIRQIHQGQRSCDRTERPDT